MPSCPLFPLKVGLFLMFICVYVSGCFVFLVFFKNYLAAAGFLGAAVQMTFRLGLFCLSSSTLYKMFPLMSLRRIIYQSFFLCVGFGLLAVGFWCLAKGARSSQPFSSESYYCSMVGIWCSAKWGFFLTIPIYNLRPDKTDTEEHLRELCLEMKLETKSSVLYHHYG